MSDLHTNFDSPLAASAPGERSNLSSRWKRTVIAGLLSLFLPGMGQLFNRQPRKALVIGIITHIFGAFVAHTRLLLSFWTMVASVLVVLVWQFLVAAEAARTAATGKKPEAPIPLPWLSYPLIGVIVAISALAPSPAHTMHESGFHVYKIPSASMCPTICISDQVVADAWAYHERAPQRGDIILFKHPSFKDLLIKRVIGLPGDFVTPGPNGSVLVNGQPFHPPGSCGHPDWAKEAVPSESSFQPKRVTEGTLFVIGDNLEQSFDSRVPEFGTVTLDMVLGKPLYFSWSSTHSRIACKIH
jgi:signal peptidase I